MLWIIIVSNRSNTKNFLTVKLTSCTDNKNKVMQSFYAECVFLLQIQQCYRYGETAAITFLAIDLVDGLHWIYSLPLFFHTQVRLTFWFGKLPLVMCSIIDNAYFSGRRIICNKQLKCMCDLIASTGSKPFTRYFNDARYSPRSITFYSI